MLCAAAPAVATGNETWEPALAERYFRPRVVCQGPAATHLGKGFDSTAAERQQATPLCKGTARVPRVSLGSTM